MAAVEVGYGYAGDLGLEGVVDVGDVSADSAGDSACGVV